LDGGGVTTIATTFWSACALRPGSIACAARPRSSDDHALEELRVSTVTGLSSPTKLWSGTFDMFALDGRGVVKWGDRGTPSPQVWATLAPGEQIYADVGPYWFLYRDGTLVRDPDLPGPRRYALRSGPSQLVDVGLQTCALVAARVVCFD
jgi:hypothetical protein